MEELLPRLLESLNLAPLPGGQKLEFIQITSNPELPVLLPCPDPKDPDFALKNTDPTSGGFISLKQFCNLLQEAKKKEKKVQKSAEIKDQRLDLAHFVEKLKENVCQVLDNVKEKIESDFFRFEPVRSYLRKFKGGFLKDNLNLLKETEKVIRLMRFDPADMPNQGMKAMEETGKEMAIFIENIQKKASPEFSFKHSLGNQLQLFPEDLKNELKEIEKHVGSFFTKINNFHPDSSYLFYKESKKERVRIAEQLMSNTYLKKEKLPMYFDFLKISVPDLVNYKAFSKESLAVLLMPFFRLQDNGLDRKLSFLQSVVSNNFKNPHFELIYLSCIDGFYAADFHSKCDGKGPTLTLIRNEFGKTFGGFTMLPWMSETGESFTDNYARLFSLDLEEIYSPVNYKEKAVEMYSRCGPRFGNLDLRIYDKCNSCGINKMGSDEKLQTYSHTQRDAIAGKEHFDIENYAVFLIKE